MENNKAAFRRLLPYITAIVVFLGLSAFCFAPQFGGKKLPMHDVTQYEGMNKAIKDHIETHGEDPQWTGDMFGGMPSVLISMKYDSMLIRNGARAFEFLGTPAAYLFIAMTAFFLMLLMFGVNPWPAIPPAIAYGLSTYFFLIIGAGHITKMVALAYIPLMVGGVYYTLRRNIWVGAALTALFTAIEIGANHPQITYYFALVMAGIWVNEGVRAFKEHTLPRFAKATAMLVVAGMLGLGANAASLWLTADYGKYSMRGGSELTISPDGKAAADKGKGLDLEYATRWSYGKAESFNMFIPDMMGGGFPTKFSDDGAVAQSLTKYGARNLAQQLPTYWGDQPGTGGPTYIGAVVIFLFVLGLFLLRGRNKWWVVVVSALAVMLSWGYNFMWLTELFFNYFPGYNKFRVVAMTLVVVEWSVPFLAALVLCKVWAQKLTREELVKGIKYSVYVTGGVALLFALFGGMMFDFISPSDAVIQQQGIPQDVISAMRAERASMLRTDAVRSLIFVLATAGTVLLFALGRIKRGALIAVVAVLVCLDLVPVNKRYLPWSSFKDAKNIGIQPTAIDLEIMKDTEPGFRVFNRTVDPFNDATTSYFHRSIGGYHGAKLQRYQDLIEFHLSQGNSEVYDMLNTKYFIVPDEQGRIAKYENTHRNGAAWFVGEIVLAGSADEEIVALDTLDTKRVAVVDRRFAPQFMPDPKADLSKLPVEERIETTYFSGERVKFREEGMMYIQTDWIELTDYKANHLTYKYSAVAPSAAVFSEIYYDRGWTAYIDGKEAPYFRADYVLRGMMLPAGEHTVEFKFKAQNFGRLSNITLICSLIIIAGAAGALIATVVRRKKRVEDAGR